MMPKHVQTGFTLIEVAIVMVIIGFMLASLLGPLGNRIEQSKTEATANKINEIIETIYGYTLINGFLPCPDTDGDGFENRSPDPANPATETICTSATGSGEPPWATLGLERLLDPWNQTFIYRVDLTFANSELIGATTNPIPWPAACIASTTASFSMCSTGDINVNDGVTILDPISNPVTQGIPAIVVSLGKPKDAAAIHPDENENGPISPGIGDDTTFISRDFRPEGAPDTFNDIVRWIPTNVLVGKMVQAQRLP